jgi:hypothetical protein
MGTSESMHTRAMQVSMTTIPIDAAKPWRDPSRSGLLPAHRINANPSTTSFAGKSWSGKVNTTATPGKSWSGKVNTTATPCASWTDVAALPEGRDVVRTTPTFDPNADQQMIVKAA